MDKIHQFQTDIYLKLCLWHNTQLIYTCSSHLRFPDELVKSERKQKRLQSRQWDNAAATLADTHQPQRARARQQNALWWQAAWGDSGSRRMEDVWMRGDFGKGHCRHTPVYVIFYLSSLNQEIKRKNGREGARAFPHLPIPTASLCFALSFPSSPSPSRSLFLSHKLPQALTQQFTSLPRGDRDIPKSNHSA